jgi:hypothetical protein
MEEEDDDDMPISSFMKQAKPEPPAASQECV